MPIAIIKTKNKEKECLYCNEQFSKRYRDSKKQWQDRKFCSQLCRNSMYIGKNHPSFGMKRSDEVKMKMSQAKLGKKLTKEHIEKLRLAKLGTILTSEHKQKISLGNMGKIGYWKGKKMSEEHRKNIGISMKGICAGEKNYRWNPDREAVRRDLRNDPVYKQWSKSVKDRDNWKCRITDKNCDGKVVAHHILPWAKFQELRYEIKNGITLCQFHHPRKRDEEMKLSPYFQELVMVKVK